MSHIFIIYLPSPKTMFQKRQKMKLACWGLLYRYDNHDRYRVGRRESNGVGLGKRQIEFKPKSLWTLPPKCGEPTIPTLTPHLLHVRKKSHQQPNLSSLWERFSLQSENQPVKVQWLLILKETSSSTLERCFILKMSASLWCPHHAADPRSCPVVDGCLDSQASGWIEVSESGINQGFTVWKPRWGSSVVTSLVLLIWCVYERGYF